MKNNYAMVIGHLRSERLDAIAQMEDPKFILTLSEVNEILELLARYREGLERIAESKIYAPGIKDIASQIIGESDD